MPTTHATLARWVLLLAVIAGVIGMHVLTAGDGPGHGMPPAAMAPGHHSDAATMPTTAPAELSAAEMPAGPGHGEMAGCILFPVVGGVALLLALARLGSASDDRAGAARHLLLDLRRRGPPDGWPRIALNVIRV